MPQNHLKFHAPDRKRRVLVADDEFINREILGAYLSENYEVLFAADGAEALDQIRRNQKTLSLVILDLNMPKVSGTEVLKAVKADAALSRIPIIVMTSEGSSEVECLSLGAIDFIPKPYPAAEVILARAQRTIEFSEDRETIASTERDPLTGLYNREFFFLYAEQYDQAHRDADPAMDAILLDINNFHTINERYGKAVGDRVLRRIGEKLRESIQDSDGIVSRREPDTFLIYCPRRNDYRTILDNASVLMDEDDSSENRVRLRMGVYSNVDKSIDIERRFDRAKMAADTVRGSLTNPIGFYDSDLHSTQRNAEQLVEEFSKAIAERQFQVFYQPKFDVRPNTPVLASAEALVRWKHPERGMISPGEFIPLFEQNGLIQHLDEYVWRETARQVRLWKDTYGFSVTVSVNVSRIDLYDPDLLQTLKSILAENDIHASDLMLEVTESAYTKDSAQIIETVDRLRTFGFRIEMDDFGTGFSSLHMLSSLPIDALKLDKEFVRDAFETGGNTNLVEMIIQIARSLVVPVVAEGVENEHQLDALRHLGCDLVQGYFFSKPVPPEEFEAFILQKKETMKNTIAEADRAAQAVSDLVKGQKNAGDSETKGKNGTLPFRQAGSRKPLRLRTINIFFSVLAAIAGLILFFSNTAVTRGYQRMEQASDVYIAASLAAADMQAGSDFLTDRVRCFVMTGNISYLEDFFEEVEVTRRRDHAVQTLEELLGSDSTALDKLSTALDLSNNLIGTEYHSMRLAIEAGAYNENLIPEVLSAIELTEEEKALSSAELQSRAEGLLFDDNYTHVKSRIRENVSLCTQDLIQTSRSALEEASGQLSLMVHMQTFFVLLLLLVVIGFVSIIRVLIRRPLTLMVEKMKAQGTINPEGAEELQFVANIYNDILEANKKAREDLRKKAFRDTLTGLNNRNAFDLLMQNVDSEHIAYLVVDVDHFKEVNDQYGHSVGDKVLCRVAEVLQHSFRSVDIISRFGGDEFVVVMTRANSSMQQLVRDKIDLANNLLLNPKDGLPPVSLSVGVAFSDRKDPQGDIFNDADTALYQVKHSGRSGCAFFGEREED